ncbi:hypothetical protein EVAR_39298_1 [Eumeta japonica]|uniref:Uncharacterized protein n=1 Tax=Eumeta variegata TaxID=151549 RepID=A0A4C1VXB4_EUMVA|nr:hypothetical protein EVAR_39298_1 [Eumeta japonica]
MINDQLVLMFGIYKMRTTTTACLKGGPVLSKSSTITRTRGRPELIRTKSHGCGGAPRSADLRLRTGLGIAINKHRIVLFSDENKTLF